jgi:hypothetical protein
MDDYDLRHERLDRRRWQAAAVVLWLLTAILAAAWIQELKDRSFDFLEFALASFIMLWLVGIVVGLAMALAQVLFERS